MVHKCFICKKSWNKSDTRSFHRFPREINHRTIWLHKLGLCEEDILTVKDAKVCSDHFSTEDVFEHHSGRYYLKFDAIPKSVAKSIVQNSMQSKARSLSAAFTASSLEHSAEESHSKKLKSVVDRSIVRDSKQSNVSSSPSKLTASPIEHSSVVSPYSKKLKLRKLRYLGDYHSSYITNLAQAKEVMNLAKTVFRNQRRKISTLQRQNLRLKSQVTFLKSVIKDLKLDQYIPSPAEVIEIRVTS